MRRSFDLREFDAPRIEMRRSWGRCLIGVAIAAGLIALEGMNVFGGFGLCIVLLPMLFCLGMVVHGVQRLPGLVLKKAGKEVGWVLLPVADAAGALQILVLLFAARGGQGAGGDENDLPPFEQHPDDAVFIPIALTATDGQISFPLTVTDAVQLVQAITVCHEHGVQIAADPKKAGKGPIYFALNPRFYPQASDGMDIVEACVAEARVWGAYNGSSVELRYGGFDE